jgi:hypothetical protein
VDGIFGNVTATPVPGVANSSDPRFVTVAPSLAAFGASGSGVDLL